VDSLQEILKWIDSKRQYCFDLLRMYLGVGLMVKGVHFIMNPEFLHDILKTEQLQFLPTAIAHYVALAHLCGGFLLVIGLLSRLAALIQIPVLMGAVFFVHANEGLFTHGQTLEFSSLVLFLLILILIHGSGPLSADDYIFKGSSEES